MKVCNNMLLKHEQRQNCGIYYVNMRFDVTMGTDEKFSFGDRLWSNDHEIGSVFKIDAFTKLNVKLVLLNGF